MDLENCQTSKIELSLGNSLRLNSANHFRKKLQAGVASGIQSLAISKGKFNLRYLTIFSECISLLGCFSISVIICFQSSILLFYNSIVLSYLF